MRWITNLFDNAIDWMIPPAPAMASPYDKFFQMVAPEVRRQFRAMGGLSQVDCIGTRIYDYQAFEMELRNLRIGEFTARYDGREDLYRVYHILAGNGRHYLVAIFDPFDPWDREEILEVIEVHETVIQNLLQNK